MQIPAAPFALLDFPAPALTRRQFVNPVQIFSAQRHADVPAVLHAAEQAALGGHWVTGFVAYEAGPAFDPALEVRGATSPLAWFAVFDTHSDATRFEAALQSPPIMRQRDAAAEDAVVAGAFAGAWQPGMSAAQHRTAVDALREAIARGDVYQVNLTFPLRAAAPSNALRTYEALRTQQQGYCAYIDTGAQQILSLSPELFFHRAERSITMRPMKGTTRRGRWPAEDALQRQRLAASEKDRAENLMIVDLIRNDLGRIAEYGTVDTTSLFDIEDYGTVFQMTSTVQAELRQNTSLGDIFAALFPSGSVTGAPKVSAMRFIRAYEHVARGVYCGAIGVIEPGGAATFSVAIRTLVVDSAAGQAVYGVGGGVTWDSSATAEYDEALSKAAVLTRPARAFDLLETMRMEDGAVARLERHVRRMDESAAYFGRTRPGDALRAAVAQCAETMPHGRYRVRALASADGRVQLETSPIETAVADPRFELAPEPMRSTDVMLFHKTTDRAHYEAWRRSHAGVFDRLYRNERAELTEFSRGNLVVELAGRKVTPPVTCGLLAGTFRAQLLESGEIAEELLSERDLERATRVWLINSVREWVEVRRSG